VAGAGATGFGGGSGVPGSAGKAGSTGLNRLVPSLLVPPRGAETTPLVPKRFVNAGSDLRSGCWPIIGGTLVPNPFLRPGNRESKRLVPTPLVPPRGPETRPLVPKRFVNAGSDAKSGCWAIVGVTTAAIANNNMVLFTFAFLAADMPLIAT